MLSLLSLTVKKNFIHFSFSDNRQNDLVRIVFFAFDRLEQILPPTFGKSPQFAAFSSDPSSSTTSLNSEREKRNITRVLNSKVQIRLFTKLPYIFFFLFVGIFPILCFYYISFMPSSEVCVVATLYFFMFSLE